MTAGVQRVAVARGPGLALLGVAYASFTTFGMTGALRGVAWPSIQTTFGLTLDAAGVWFITGTLGFMLANMTIGRFVAWLGLGRMLTLSSLLAAVGLAAVALAPEWWIVIVVGMVGGAGSGLINSGINTFVATNYSPRYMNWLHAAFGLGGMFGPVVMSGLLQSGLSWRWGYGLTAALQALLTLCFALTLRQWHIVNVDATEDSSPIEPAPARATLALPALWFSMTLFLLSSGIEGTTGQWAYTYYTQGRAVDAATAAWWISIYWASFTVGRVFFGLVSDRFTVRTLLRVGIAGAVVGAALFGVQAIEAVSYAGLAVLGFMVAPVAPLLTSNAPRQLGPAHAANAIGFQFGGASLGISVVPALAGFLAERIGLGVIVPFMLMMALAMMLVYELSLRAARG